MDEERAEEQEIEKMRKASRVRSSSRHSGQATRERASSIPKRGRTASKLRVPPEPVPTSDQKPAPKGPSHEPTPTSESTKEPHVGRPARQRPPTHDMPCDECEDLMRKAAEYKEEDKEAKVFQHLTAVVNKKHGIDPRHKNFRARCIEHLAANLAIKKDEDIPKALLEINADGCRDLIGQLAQRRKWWQIYHLVLAFRKKKGWGSLNLFARLLSLLKFVEDTASGSEEEQLKILGFFLDNGGVLQSKEMIKCAMKKGDSKMVIFLLEKETNLEGLTLTPGDTPLHAALFVALEKDIGNFTLFDKLTSCDANGNKIFKNLDLKCQDDMGNNLLHQAAKAQNSQHAIKAVERLCKDGVPRNQRNKMDELPLDCLCERQDPRAEFLSDLAWRSSSAPSDERPKFPSSGDGGKAIQEFRKQILQTLSQIQDCEYDIFAPLVSDEEDEEDETEEEESSCEEDDVENDDSLGKVSDDSNDISDDENDGNNGQTPEISVDASTFDNMPWEVECTEEVWNVLKARKEKQGAEYSGKNELKVLRKERITDDLKRLIVGKIQDLASGNWRSSLTRRLRNLPSSLQLFYVKLPQGGFILWELAVAFSPKCSKLMDENEATSSSGRNSSVESGRIYTEIIRVWSVSSGHSSLKPSIQRIVKSHQNGKKCIVKKNLKCISSGYVPQASTSSRFPMRYQEADVTVTISNEDEDTTKLCPPASTGRTEYHILKFYTFSSTLVATILKSITTKVEFPFKVTDKEHELINLQTQSPLLLIGRSGTGKTTVCLYRLWAKFLGYWEQVGNDGEKILPRILPALSDEDDEEDQSTSEEDEEESGKKKKLKAFSYDASKSQSDLSLKDCAAEAGKDEDDVSDNDDDDDGEHESSEEERGHPREEFHHLHQLFVTKNPKLCSEVKKSFQRLCHGVDLTACQTKDQSELPNILDDISDNAFPVFLTSRQLLIMLDASVEGKPFFERDENFALKAAIPGWGTHRDIFHDIPLEVDSSDDESGGAAIANAAGVSHQHRGSHGRNRAGARSKHKPKGRECTYDIFSREVWSKIKKKEIQCHPSLVWTEIMSFIKGSYEALHTEKGCLDEQQYIDIGRKRAPNFTADRREVYKVFKGYAAYKTKNYLFDEADLVFDLYKRLKGMRYRPWVFHQIYIDEIQDFTQGELYLLIALSEDPNEMLLTGDTAQTIMRGIAFRFEDVRSLFYYAQEAAKASHNNLTAIKLPKGYEQLQHNYRSHTGILSLAISVLNLLAEFFKDSFDILEPDQGMFPGPLPVVIETSKSSNLALLLSGNRRKTSHIEFGAHQAILVMNEEAKETIPKELQSGILLTIYESKGLEFDDILIYNFFKHSKATDEWRVVTNYLNSLRASTAEQVPTNYGPVTIDKTILQGTRRPHPLAFDANKHKVLNAELKQLYTAITRARVNVWLFDEDAVKRAPMFEYFNALRLVRYMKNADEEQAFQSDAFFAEESTPKEWRKKGDVFMAQKLYSQAAKCYEKGGSTEKKNLAQAHHLAQEAGQMMDKENASPRVVRAAYFKAGVEFLYCGVLRHAAICFLNAKEILLAAMALEKNGEFGPAGLRYKKASEYEKASKCFRKCGMYQQAVQTLADAKEYELAIDCVLEYEDMIQTLRDEKKAIPQVLIDNRPSNALSETNLLIRLTEEYARAGDERQLKFTIRRLSNSDEQVRLLCEHKFYVDAATILKNQGKFEEAVQLLMEEGYLKEALDFAEMSLVKPLCASVHLAIACKAYSDLLVAKEEDKDDPVPIKEKVSNFLKEKVSSHLSQAKNQYTEINDEQAICQINLLNGLLHEDAEKLKRASKKFYNCLPANPVGAIEAFKEFMKIVGPDSIDVNDIPIVLEVIKSGLQVIETLRNPSTKNADMEMSYLKSYELQQTQHTDMVKRSYNQVPLSLLTKPRLQQERFKHPKEKSKIVSVICNSLENDLVTWIKAGEKSLNEKLTGQQLCGQVLLGNQDRTNGCPKCHSVEQSERTIISTFHILCQMVKLEGMTQDFLGQTGKTNKEKWQSTESLIDFLPPFTCGHRFSSMRKDVLAKVLHKIRTNGSVKRQLCRYFTFLWSNSGRVGKGKSQDLVKERAKESGWLIQTCFYARLLDLRLDVDREAFKLEDELMRRGKDWLSKNSKYAIFTAKDDKNGTCYVESLGGRFITSFNYLTGSGADGKANAPDMFEAFFPFTKLLGAFGKRGNFSLMPRQEHLLFWMEFYTVLSFCFLSEIQWRKNKTPCRFIIPGTYKNVIDIVSLCKGASSVEEEVASHIFEQRNPTGLLHQRQKFIINLLTGCEYYSKISLLDEVKDLCNGSQQERLTAERIIVLALVLLLNLEFRYVDKESQLQIRRSLQKLTYPNKGCGRRLSFLIDKTRAIAHALDVKEALDDFLTMRDGEELCSAIWDHHQSLHVTSFKFPEATKKKLIVPYPEIPLNENPKIPVSESDTIEDDGEVERPNQDELERESQSRNKMRAEEEQQTRAVQIIVRFLRLSVMKMQLRKKSFRHYERELQFESYVLTDMHCGVCLSMTSDLKDHPVTDENLTQAQIHGRSPEHMEKMTDFLRFKNLYINQIHDRFRAIETFMLRRNVLASPQMYYPANVFNLIYLLEAFGKEKNKQMTERLWVYEAVEEAFNKLEQAFLSSYKYIDYIFMSHQEQSQKETEHATANSAFDNDLGAMDEVNTLDDLTFNQPTKKWKQKSQHNKKNYRGRRHYQRN